MNIQNFLEERACLLFTSEGLQEQHFEFHAICQQRLYKFKKSVRFLCGWADI